MKHENFWKQLYGGNLVVVVLLITTLMNLHPEAVAQDDKKVKIVNVSEGDTSAFNAVRNAFMSGNPGYDLHYYKDTRIVKAKDKMQVVFVQEIEGVTDQEGIANLVVTGGSKARRKSQAIVGDVIIVSIGEVLESDREVGLLLNDRLFKVLLHLVRTWSI